MTLRCHSCGNQLSVDMFWRHAGKPRGYQNDCKICIMERRDAKNPAREVRNPPSRDILFFDFVLR